MEFLKIGGHSAQIEYSWRLNSIWMKIPSLNLIIAEEFRCSPYYGGLDEIDPQDFKETKQRLLDKSRAEVKKYNGKISKR